MSIISLADARAHLAVIHSDDDALIQGCIDAAEAYAANYMNRPPLADPQVVPWVGQGAAEDSSSSSSSEPLVPADVRQAVLMLVGEYYEHRTQGVTTGYTKLPAVESILHFHRVGLGL